MRNYEQIKDRVYECYENGDDGDGLSFDEAFWLLDTIDEMKEYLEKLWHAYTVTVSNGGGSYYRHVEPLLPDSKVLLSKLERNPSNG